MVGPTDYSALFRLYDPLANRPLRLTTEGESNWLSLEQAAALSRGELSLQHPLRLRAYMGGQVTDFLWSDLASLVVISRKVVELLRDRAFTGWATYPVEVYDRKGEPLVDYFGLAITGRAGKQDRTRSRILTKPAPAPGGQPYQVYRGFYFDESQWDSSDIFLADGFKVVTLPVQKAFKRARVSNVHFTPLADVEIDVFLDRFDPESQSGQP